MKGPEPNFKEERNMKDFWKDYKELWKMSWCFCQKHWVVMMVYFTIVILLSLPVGAYWLADKLYSIMEKLETVTHRKDCSD